MSQKRITEYIETRRRLLDLLFTMWFDPLVQCYNDKEKPTEEDERRLTSIFLAGPTSRNQILEYNWRCEAVAYLREAGFVNIQFKGTAAARSVISANVAS